MSTVIIGGGIIGVSTAYYLSLSLSNKTADRKPNHQIHIVDPAAELFDCASGYAAGFLARNWFAPEIAELGALSFDLHAQLAADNAGRENWGYVKSTALSLQVEYTDGQKSARGDDWLRKGASRAEVAVRADERRGDEPDPSPEWLTRQAGGVVERISDVDGTAQLDPQRLCKFLLARCIENGVQIHSPSRTISLTKDPSSNALKGVKLQHLQTNHESTIPCTNLIFAAGAWTPRAFAALFPKSTAHIPVTTLAGYSLLLRSPRHSLAHEQEKYGGTAHAVFTTHPRSAGFAPESVSRQGGEIYVAGLNSFTIPLPELAADAHQIMERKEIDRLRKATVTLFGRLDANAVQGDAEGAANIDDLETVREALCFRPWTESGRPIVGRVGDHVLGDNIRPVGGVYMAAGHGPWGISLSLGTGKVMSELIAGRRTSADVSKLGLEGAVGKAKL
ncbi:hypothetical protein FQN52_000386 [Onygenales sp. PD_12]|nr:hypothetical protein FQN52_000386 [Onygenales sp. PD_12]